MEYADVSPVRNSLNTYEVYALFMFLRSSLLLS